MKHFFLSRFRWKQSYGAPVALFFVAVLALGLRLINLGAESFWGDEILSLQIVREFASARDLYQYVGWIEIHPPLYYLFLQRWLALVPTNEFTVRLPSVVLGVGIVLLTYVLGKQLFASRRLGLIAALVVALMPLQIEMSQDARPYVFFTALGLMAIIALWRYLQTYKLRWLFYYTITLALGFYFHYSAALIIATAGIVWFGFIIFDSSHGRRRSQEVVRFIVTHAAIIFLYAPWLPYLLYKMVLRNFALFGYDVHPDPQNRTPAFASYVPQQLVWLSLQTNISKIEIIAIWLAVAAMIGCLVWWLMTRAREGKTTIESSHRRPLLFVMSLAAVMLIVYLLSPQSEPYTDIYQRHILIWTCFFAIILAYLVCQLSRRLGMALLALFLVSLVPFVVDVVGNDDHWDVQHRLRFVAGVINEYHQPGDIIVTENAFFRTDFNYYLKPELSAIAFMPTNYTGIDWLNTRNTLGLMENELQFRLRPATAPEVFWKFDYLIERYEPKRVWLPYFTSPMADIYFTSRGWRKIVWSRRPLLMLDMYEAPGVALSDSIPAR